MYITQNRIFFAIFVSVGFKAENQVFLREFDDTFLFPRKRLEIGETQAVLYLLMRGEKLMI